MPTADALPSPGDRALAAAADALARRLMERLPAGRAVPRDAISTLPPAVATPLLARLDARVDREAPAPASPWVDADAARAGARQWRDAARLAARVPAPEWPAFLGDACRLVVSHLVRPAETLAAVAFEDDGDAERPAALVMRRLGAFAPYPYLPEIARQYVDRKGIARIDRAALESLLRRIDRRMVAAFSADEWAGLLEPLFTLLDAPSGLPAELLQVLFEARGRDDLGRLFSGPVTPGALYATLARALPPPAPTVAPSPPEPPPVMAPPPEQEPAPTVEPFEAPPVDGPFEALPADLPLAEPASWEPASPETPPDAPLPAEPPAEPPADEHADEHAPDLEAYDDWRARDPDLSDWLRSASAAPPGPPPPIPPVPPSAQEEPDAPEPALRPPWFTNAPASHEPDPDPPEDASGDDEPLWMRLMTPPADPDLQDEIDASAAAPAAPTETPLWKRFIPHAAELTDADLPRPPVAPPRAPLPGPPAPAERPRDAPDLAHVEARALGAAPDPIRRAVFIAELFGGSQAEYAATLARLADAATLDAATEIFQTDVLTRHHVNVYSEPATAFAAAAESRFRPAR